MSLLQRLPFQTYNELIRDNEWALKAAKIMKLKTVKSAKELINSLDRRGYSLEQFTELLAKCQEVSLPQRSPPSTREASSATLKVAILVANSRYCHWSDLITPLSDVRLLGKILEEIGFMVIELEDVDSDGFRNSIEEVCLAIPPESYVLFYFAGHGFELCGTKYMLGVESPSEKYTINNGVSENFILKNGFLNKPELFILLLDMCRTQPDRSMNKEIYSNIAPMEEFKNICNLIIGYATSPYMPAYEECCQVDMTMSQSQHGSCRSCLVENEPSESAEDSDTLGNRETKRIRSRNGLKGVSLYVNHLSKHLKKNEDFVRILEMVHKDFAKLQGEQAILQKPQKLDNVAKRFYLSREARGDKEAEEKIRRTVSELSAKGVNIKIKQ